MSVYVSDSRKQWLCQLSSGSAALNTMFVKSILEAGHDQSPAGGLAHTQSESSDSTSQLTAK